MLETILLGKITLNYNNLLKEKRKKQTQNCTSS
jgi:hypothetical protein